MSTRGLSLTKQTPRICSLVTIVLIGGNGCGSNDPTNISTIYNVTYSLDVEGTQSEVTDIFWTAPDGSVIAVTNPPDDWQVQILAFSGDPIGARLEGSVSNGEIRISLSATSPGVTGITGTDSCSEGAGILTTCGLTLSSTTLP